MNLSNVSKQILGITTGILTVVTISEIFIDHYHPDLINYSSNYTGSGRDVLDKGTIITALIFILLVSALLFLLKSFQVKNKRCRPLLLFLSFVIFSEFIYNTIGTFIKLNNESPFFDYSTFHDYNAIVQKAVDDVKNSDQAFYRIEKLFRRDINDVMGFNMYGVSHSTSLVNSKIITLISSLGLVSHSGMTIWSEGLTPISQSVLGIKYLLHSESNNPNLILEGEKLKVQKNNNAMPICYLADSEIKTTDLVFEKSFSNLNTTLSALVGQDNYQYFNVLTNDIDFHVKDLDINQFQALCSGYDIFPVDDLDTEATCTLKMPTTANLYLDFTTLILNECHVFVNSEYLGEYSGTTNMPIIDLGYYSAGDDVTLKFVYKQFKDKGSIYDTQIATLDTIAVDRDFQKLKIINADTICERVDPTHLRICVDAEDNQILFTTIPIEKGWKVYVDGIETEYYEVLNALIGVDLTPGLHTIDMYYYQPMYPFALYTSLAGLLLFVVLILIDKRGMKLREAVQEYSKYN